MGAIAGGASGYVASGNWQGALFGAVAGGGIGFLSATFAAQAGTTMGSMFLTEAAYVAGNGLAGGFATMAVNATTGKPLSDGLGFGVAVGVFAPLASGEATLVAAGGAEALGVPVVIDYAFSGVTSLVSIVAAATDPHAAHGFTSTPEPACSGP